MTPASRPERPDGGTRVRHVLLDADGVLQRVDAAWQQAAAPYLGGRARELLETFWAAEGPALVGGADVVETLASALRALDIEADADELYPQIWLRIEVLDHTRELLGRLRSTGVGVHLGTNQTRHRAAHMRRVLGYDALFDVSAYSCDLGVAKPDPRFFTRAVDLIGARAGEVLFVDDHEANVAGAAEAGLVAVHWHYTHGLDALERRLDAAGLPLTS